MQFAEDHNEQKVHVDETHSNEEYYCPYCGQPLVVKKGDIRVHHFAHKPHCECRDSWHGSYDISSWHTDWQNLFPKENQEVKLQLGSTVHRADILTGRTVVEFQHSVMQNKPFEDRNNFYSNLGYKVVWLFDLSDQYERGSFSIAENGSFLACTWKTPAKVFSTLNIETGNADLFFQLKNGSEHSIIRVLKMSNYGIESFTASPWMDQKDFLDYVGFRDGCCLSPERMDLSDDAHYQKFKETYHLSSLNRQQERAMQSIEGAVLLLAVPGSGKTTVLVNRIGYMILEKGIDPRSILAITYNKKAASEMKERFQQKFGAYPVEFRTINSLALEIYEDFCAQNNHPVCRTQDPEDAIKTLSRIVFNIQGEWLSQNEMVDLQSAITYAKNHMLSEEDQKDFNQLIGSFSEIYTTYNKTLKASKKMDFDDQLTFAHYILSHFPSVLSQYQKRYAYILVDEAQDTSKIQHEIIQMLVGNQGNLFMVGDEDQSIYGFRGAYPKAFLNFRYDYKNPYILPMERNYRSSSQIVEKASQFIKANTGRYEKNMISDRGDGEEVHLISVSSRLGQFRSLLHAAQSADSQTAFLYRNNDSAVVLIDLLDRNRLPFVHEKPVINFFTSRTVTEMTAYLTLTIDPYCTDTLGYICNKGIFYLKKQQRDFAVRQCEKEHCTVFEALEAQMKYVKYQYQDRAKEFQSLIQSISKTDTVHALQEIYNSGYGQYLNENHLGTDDYETLLLLAISEPNIANFLHRLEELKEIVQKKHPDDDSNAIVLSTIHTAKGQEFDTVYMVDVYDGRFPSSRQGIYTRSKDADNGEQEERRLFYVGITRAKNRLYLFDIEKRPSSYVNELFPEAIAERKRRKNAEQLKEHLEKSRREQEEIRRRNEFLIAERRKAQEQKERATQEKRRKIEEARKVQEKQKKLEDYEHRYLEVKDKFTQQEIQIRDHTKQRWVQCTHCRGIKPDYEFAKNGGPGKVNLGLCKDCEKKGFSGY